MFLLSSLKNINGFRQPMLNILVDGDSSSLISFNHHFHLFDVAQGNQ